MTSLTVCMNCRHARREGLLPEEPTLNSEAIEILKLVEEWVGSQQAALFWFRSLLPSCGDQSAEDLVRLGRIEDVKSYLDRSAAGGFA